MFKMGSFYITSKGRLVKLFNQFAFTDGYVINAAVYTPGAGWAAARYTTDGRCNMDFPNNNINLTETFHKYGQYLTYTVYFDRTANCWRASGKDPYGAIIVDLNTIENRERATNLVLVGAEQKLLTWMHEAGYDEEKEVVNE